MKRILMIMVLVVFALSAGVLARTWYINPEGTGDVPDIRAGISSAARGDTLLLADGVYAGDGNTGLSYQGKAIVIRSQSGDPHACVIDCDGSEGNNVRGFTFNQREGSRSVLEGVTITNGYVHEGGGIYCWASSPTITDVILSGNVARRGGGIYCGRGSVPVLRNVTFYANSAVEGGAIYCTYYAGPSVENTIIAYSGQGGAVVLSGEGNTPTFTCCDIYGNVGGDWTGAINNRNGQSGNICEDPLFCLDANPEKPYSLHSDSPCICGPQLACGIMGATGVGCWSGVEATVDIDPDVMNPRSRRRWVTGYVELAGGYDPQDIDVSTVLLNGEVRAEMHPTAVGDHDEDGIADRMVKFPWSDALASLAGFGRIAVEVSGDVGGEAFSGTDTVLVLGKDLPSRYDAQGTEPEMIDNIVFTNSSPGGDGVAIQFDVLKNTHLRLTVHDVRGRLVRTLADDVREPNSYTIRWDGKDASQSDVAPGVYFIRFEAEEYRTIDKIILVR